MTRIILLILIIFSLFTGSCTSRKNKIDHSEMISEKDLVSIITDIYIADGLLSLPKINNWYSSRDTLSIYPKIIEKYGYSAETMDKTMNYYFIKKPKKLIEIYDKVLGLLSERESYLEIETGLEQERNANLWRGNKIYSFPDISGNDSTSFSITFERTGVYNLMFSATLFPDDQSINPRITAYTINADSIETGKRQYYKSISYIKDGQPHNYSLIIKVTQKTPVNFIGCLYDQDNCLDEFNSHAKFDNIYLTYSIGGQ